MLVAADTRAVDTKAVVTSMARVTRHEAISNSVGTSTTVDTIVVAVINKASKADVVASRAATVHNLVAFSQLETSARVSPTTA